MSRRQGKKYCKYMQQGRVLSYRQQKQAGRYLRKLPAEKAFYLSLSIVHAVIAKAMAAHAVRMGSMNKRSGEFVLPVNRESYSTAKLAPIGRITSEYIDE